MSTLENIAVSDLNRIPLRRRISELMEEKGEGHSIRSFANHTGINRETLRQMLLGTRHIIPSELQMISDGLGVSVERLKQMDTTNEYCKTLIQLKDHSSASRVIAEHLDLAQVYPDLYGKLMISYSVAEGNPSFAERVVFDARTSLEVRLLACKCLMDYYSSSSIGDAEMVMRYYKMGRMFSGKDSEFFD